MHSDGFTALHYAALNGNLEVVGLLIESNADPELSAPGPATGATWMTKPPDLQGGGAGGALAHCGHWQMPSGYGPGAGHWQTPKSANPAPSSPDLAGKIAGIFPIPIGPGSGINHDIFGIPP